MNTRFFNVGLWRYSNSYFKAASMIDETISMVNRYYEDKEFEYIKTGLKMLPHLDNMHRSAECLVKCVEGLV